ncbi:MAG: hypothetical protein AB7T31_01365 [Gemmatimonadales bacterium]
MVRRSLIATALWVVASPLAAQMEPQEHVWTAGRPDSEAPIGVLGARTLEAGALKLTYHFKQENSRGVWFATDSLPLATTLQLYTVAPLTLSNITHSVTGAYGVTDRLTVTGTAEFSLIEREQITNGGVLYITGVEALGDLTASAIYEVVRQGPYRLNFSGGALIPIGKARTYADTPFGADQALPYDQRPSGGAFAVIPGISGQVQNEVASLGAQFKARIYVGEGTADYTPGDRYQADGWAAYAINSVVSVSAGLRWATWGRLEGADPQLTPTQDPGSDPVTGMAGGQRADMPIGVNVLLPGSSVLAGHRLYAEAVYAMHHDYEGVRLGLDWGFNFGWSMEF